MRLGFVSPHLSAPQLILTKQDRIADQNFEWNQIILHHHARNPCRQLDVSNILKLRSSPWLSIQGWPGQLSLFSVDREVIRRCYAGGCCFVNGWLSAAAPAVYSAICVPTNTTSHIYWDIFLTTQCALAETTLLWSTTRFPEILCIGSYSDIVGSKNLTEDWVAQISWCSLLKPKSIGWDSGGKAILVISHRGQWTYFHWG